MFIKTHTARVVEATGCGVIIGAVLGLLTGVFITGSTDDSVIRRFIFGGIIFGGTISFISGLIRDIHEVKKTLAKKMKRLNESEKTSLLAEVLGKELIPVQVWAIKELGEIGNGNAIDKLKKALNHSSRFINSL